MSDRIPLSFRRFWHGTENQSKSKRFNSRLDLVKGFTGNEEMKRAHYKGRVAPGRARQAHVMYLIDRDQGVHPKRDKKDQIYDEASGRTASIPWVTVWMSGFAADEHKLSHHEQ